MKSPSVSEQPYISGEAYGLPPSVRIHRLANIACTEFVAGPNTRIDAFVTLTGKVKLGANCHIGHGSAVFGAFGFEMGEGSSLSAGVKVFTATTDLESGHVSSPALQRAEALKAGPVKLGRYVEVGSNSVILPGVDVGDEVQVGALALVNRSLAGHGIYAGAPARFLRPRPKLSYG